MADSMEEIDDKTDTDLQMDRNDFRKTQFDVFKHNFLESFDEAGYEKLEHLTLNAKLKKEVVNMVRKLQRAKITLDTLKGEEREPFVALAEKIEEIFKQLIEFSKQSSEYSTRNIKLPEYNRQDMEALLGKSLSAEEEAFGKKKAEYGAQEEVAAKEEEENPVQWLCKSNEEYEKKIIELLGAGELLMNEWHEIRNYIRDI